MKLKKSAFAIFASITAMSLTACGAQKDVTFWSSFGGKYTEILKSLVKKIEKETSISIKHESKGSYPGILKQMVASIGTSKYPSIAIGYPDHFAQYHGSGILVQLDDHFKDVIKQYDKNYMPENYLYDTNGEKHLYGVPFNKSTELLGYNGVFVDYVANKNGANDEEIAELKKVPATWDEWAAARSDPTSKAGLYLKEFEDLIDNGRTLYAVQDADGTAHDFSYSPASGKVKVLDYSNMDAATKAQTRLFCWDSLDNAFITLVRQWDSQYTELPKDQIKLHPKERAGKVLFANKKNLPKTVEMLKFFNKMYEDKIFGTPSAELKAKFSSEPFAQGRVMFMVCSSGGLSYNTENWEKRFRMAPIPYHTEDHKYVISQGANICMTKKANAKKAVQVIKALTTGKFQTEWALKTGYFPASSTAEETPEYQNFLKSTSFKDKTVAIYREGHQVNYNEYRPAANKWNRFVDDAFIGSATVRTLVADILPNVFKNVAVSDTGAGYKKEIKKILQDPLISSSLNITVDSDLI